jgi:predicted GNAT family acetyltransferase
MIRFACMSVSDIPFAVKLSSQEKWGTPPSDFMRILRLGPHGSFVAFDGNSRVGMITTMTFGKELAWIGNVIVDKNHRGKHIGQDLMNYAIDHLTKLQIRHIGLYCFTDNVGFYRRLGFVGGMHFVRLRRPRRIPSLFENEPGKQPSLPQVLSLDRRAFGADRSKLIRSWIRDKSAACFGFTNGRTSGFLLVKGYSTMFDFGPGAAFGASQDDLNKLLAEALEYSWRKPIEASCLARNRTMLKLLSEYGFRTVNSGFRMYWNHDATLGSDRSAILLGFPDKG